MLPLPSELIKQIGWWRRLYDLDPIFAKTIPCVDPVSGRAWTFNDREETRFLHGWRFISPNRRISGLMSWYFWKEVFTTDGTLKAPEPVAKLFYDLPYRRWNE